jgi:hypothetical protein
MKIKIGVLTLGVLLYAAGMVQAVPITIEISGTVTSASGSALPSTIYQGVTFTGTYTYDSSAIDSGDGHHYYDAPYGISLSLGGYEFKTAPNHVGQFDMWITTNGPGLASATHVYSVCSQYQNISIPSVGFNIGTIRWDLADSTQTALSSDTLPVTAPVLANWDYNHLRISSYDGTNGIWIYGTVTQATPEPLSSVLMTIGVFLLRRRR